MALNNRGIALQSPVDVGTGNFIAILGRVGALSFVGVLAAVVILQGIDATPLPFLVLTVAFLVNYGAGLYSRFLRLSGVTPAANALIVAPITGVATTLAIIAAGALGSSLFAASEVKALETMKGVVTNEGQVFAFLIAAAAGAYASFATIPFLFLGIPLTLYFIWIVGPTFMTGYIAFTRWDGVTTLDKTPFIGLANFDRLFKDRLFEQAFWNNIRWLLFFITIPTSMGLGLAMLFNSKFLGARFFKIAFYSPLIIAPVVVGLVWENMYRPTDGLINSFLRIFTGPEASLPGWLADRNLALWCIIVAAAWRQVGYVMILYLAGLKSLDTSLVEAAIVDGAGPWTRFYKVIFPLLGPVTVVVAVVSVIDSLRAFDLVAVITRGGPSGASQVLANFMYIEAFNNYQMGYAAAVGVVLLVLMLFFIVPYLLNVRRTELEF
ncbi:MAG: hypothetical protein OHK0023_18740 [Anaerolineae bacterium]